MENFRYVKELFNSFGDVFRKPMLLLPFVYLFVLSTIFLLIIPPMPIVESTSAVDYNLILMILGLNLIQILIAIVFNGMSLGTFRRYVENEEITVGKQVNDGFRMYWKLLLLRIYQVLLIMVPLIMVLIISGAMGNKTAILIVGAILILIFLVYIIMVALYFMFSNVIISYEGKSASQALRESYKYFKKNSTHTFFTFLVLAGFLLILVVIVLIISLSSMLLSIKVNPNGTMPIWSSIIIGLISIPVSAAMMLYIFKAFKAVDFSPEIKEEKSVQSIDAKTVKKDAKVEQVAQQPSTASSKATKSTKKTTAKPVKKAK